MKRTRVVLFCIVTMTMLLATGFRSIACPQNGSTPSTYPAELPADLKKLQQAALASEYAYKQVAHLSNNIGPRLSGSPQAQKAVEYVADALRKLGCVVQLEKVTVAHWV